MQILVNNGAGCARIVLNPHPNSPCSALESSTGSSGSPTVTGTSGSPTDSSTSFPIPSISPIPSSSLTNNLPYLYNVPIITGAVAVLIIALLQASNIMHAKTTTSHSQYTDSKESNYEQSAFLIAPPLTAQSPSIYDV